MKYFDGFIVLFTFACGYLLYMGSWLDSKKYERHVFYFRVLTFGILWQGAWYCIAWWVNSKHGWAFLPIGVRPSPHTSPWAVAFTSIFVPMARYALVQGYYEHLQSNALKARRHIKFFRKSSLYVQELLVKSFIQESTVMVTLDNHKVYIGWVSDIPQLHEEISAISLSPIFSGYRSAESSLHLTTDYARAIKASDDNARPQIVVKYDKIISVQSFDIDIYKDAFQKNNALESAAS